MRSSLKIIGICGWAIPPVWFQKQISSAFPDSSVQTFYPQFPAEEREANEFIKSRSADLWIGYSLGSLWLLKNASLLPPTARMALLCPIFGFTREMGQGGKTRTVQLNYIARNLERTPDDSAPRVSFLKEIGIDPDEKEFDFRIHADTLIRGLHFLRDHSIETSAFRPHISLIGEQDPLIDSQVIMKKFPNLRIIPNTGHHPGPLLSALANSIPEIFQNQV